MDEFTGQKPVWFLNRWLDGNNFHLKQRNSPGTNKQFNIPTIIISNYHPEDIFKAAKTTGSVAGLVDRLEIIYVDQEFTIEFQDASPIMPPSNLLIVDEDEKEKEKQKETIIIPDVEDEFY